MNDTGGHFKPCMNISSNCTGNYGNSFTDLNDLNYQTLQQTVPVIIYICTLMLVGTFGNSLTIYVYQCTFQKHSSTIFIIAVAIFDLLGCVVAMPLEIYDLVFQYTFYSSSGCKAIHFVRNVLVFASSFLLVEIAFDRYVKICRPWITIQPSTIKWMCACTGGCAILFSVPALVIFGITRIKTPINGTLGYDCAFDGEFKGGLFQQIYFYILGVLFIAILSSLSGFYLKIWYEIRKRYRTVKSRPSVKFVKEADSPTVTTRLDNTRELAVTETSRQSGSSVDKPKALIIKKRVSRRTTLIFSAVSGVFILTYLPALSILIWRSLKDHEGHFTIAEEIVYRLHMFNNVINPVFYGFLNPQFRNNCLGLISRYHPDSNESTNTIRETRNFPARTRVSKRISRTTISTYL